MLRIDNESRSSDDQWPLFKLGDLEKKRKFDSDTTEKQQLRSLFVNENTSLEVQKHPEKRSKVSSRTKHKRFCVFFKYSPKAIF